MRRRLIALGAQEEIDRVTVDLERFEIRGPENHRCHFQIAAAQREALLEGHWTTSA